MLSLAFFLPLPASAHKISLFAWPEGNKIYAQSYFAKNRPAMNAKITATNKEGRLLANGTTDKDGLWSFAQPEDEFVFLSVNSGDGHKASFALSLPASEKQDASLPPPQLPAEKGVSNAKADFQQLIPRASSKASAFSKTISPAALDSTSPESQMVLQELLREVKALQHAVADLQQDLRQSDETSLKDIFAGLGWIAGLMALIWFIKTRNSKA